MARIGSCEIVAERCKRAEAGNFVSTIAQTPGLLLWNNPAQENKQVNLTEQAVGPSIPGWIRTGSVLAAVGQGVLRYGLVAILLLFGVQKWTKPEADAIQSFMANSPLFSWLYHFASVQSASIVIGVVELVCAILIALRHWLPLACAAGSAITIGMFLSTLTFLVTTPHMDASTQGFVIKDILSLGVALWSTGEALLATQFRTTRSVAKAYS